MSEKNCAGTFAFLGLAIFLILTSCPFAMAKLRPSGAPKMKNLEIGFIKGIRGEAALTIQHSIQIPPDNGLLQFQNGNLIQDVEFYQAPRCYLHFKKDAAQQKELSAGQLLKVSKIDNIYSSGSIHVTFWFDDDENISDLACVTNYHHTLTIDELKNTLGSHVKVTVTKSIEKDALFNTAPMKNAKILSEESDSSHYPIQAARLVLQSR